MSSSVTSPPIQYSQASGDPFKEAVTKRLDDARQKVLVQRTTAIACSAAAFILVLLALMAAMDYLWVVPRSLRATWLALVLFAVSAACLFGVLTRMRRYRVADVAIAVERNRPDYGQRLRTALDYDDPFASPAPANPDLVRALNIQTVQVARAEDFEQVVERVPLLLSVAILVGAAMICMMGLMWGSEQRIAAGRTLLLPLEYTQVTFTPGKATVKKGEDVEVAVEIEGRPVESAKVVYRPANSTAEWSELPLAAPDGAADSVSGMLEGKLVAKIERCQDDIEFLVVAGPRDLPRGHIRVLQPLELVSFHADILPPAYVGRPSETTDKPDMKVMEGSDVAFEFELNRAAARAELVPVSTGGSKAAAEPSQQAAVPLLAEEKRLAGSFADLRNGLVFDLKAVAADGIELSPVRLSIRVQPDGKPRIRFLNPPEELEVTPTTEIGLSIEAGDDLGVHKVGIACQVADGPMHVLWEQDFAGATEPIQAMRSLPLENYKVTFQDGVTYYAFAEDHYFGQPRRTSTQLRFVDIRPYKRSYQMLDTGGT